MTAPTHLASMPSKTQTSGSRWTGGGCMRDWMKMIPAAELQTYRKAGLFEDAAPGMRPALLVIDVTMGFCGSPGLSLDQAIAEFPSACGPAAWAAMPRIAAL